MFFSRKKKTGFSQTKRVYITGMVETRTLCDLSETLGQISSEMVLRDITIDDLKVEIHIQSPGGCMNSGIGIAALLKRFPCYKEAIIWGKCYSIAAYIACAANYTVMYDKAFFLIHDPKRTYEDRQVGIAEHLEQYEMLKYHNDILLEAYVQKTGKDYDTISKLSEEEKILTAKQAHKFGFVDEVITAKRPKKKANEDDKKHVYKVDLFGDVNDDWFGATLKMVHNIDKQDLHFVFMINERANSCYSAVIATLQMLRQHAASIECEIFCLSDGGSTALVGIADRIIMWSQHAYLTPPCIKQKDLPGWDHTKEDQRQSVWQEFIDSGFLRKISKKKYKEFQKQTRATRDQAKTFGFAIEE